MTRTNIASRVGALALATALAGCATWHDMDRSEKGTAVGATGGAVAGALIGGPVGAAVGAGVGGYVGHHQGVGSPSADDRYASGRIDARPMAGSETVRSAQAELNRRGFDAGPADGYFGPSTAGAVRQFQRANNVPETGDLDSRTLSALGLR